MKGPWMEQGFSGLRILSWKICKVPKEIPHPSHNIKPPNGPGNRIWIFISTWNNTKMSLYLFVMREWKLESPEWLKLERLSIHLIRRLYLRQFPEWGLGIVNVKRASCQQKMGSEWCLLLSCKIMGPHLPSP